MRKIIFLLFILTACTSAITSNVVKEYTQPTEVYFCPRDNCSNILINALQQAQQIKCAIYDIDVPGVIHALNSKNALLVLDDQSSNKSELVAIIDSKYTQMHNKFCILDNQTVITGSMNPTIRDTMVNNNNLIIFHSKKLAQTYSNEFEELYSGTFSGGKATKDNVYYINNEIVSAYFCPEDWCANKVLYSLDTAQSSIYFMTFSFTHDQIGAMLIKKKNQGLVVKGVMEKSQNNQYSEFNKLNESGIGIMWDKNKANMHHKVFIVDEKIVITGSFNPSLNGDTKNDENLIIIHSKEIAQKYVNEFNLLFTP